MPATNLCAIKLAANAFTAAPGKRIKVALKVSLEQRRRPAKARKVR